MSEFFTPDQIEKIQLLLLNWFDRNQRELPWRETRDPYRIWISEVMLQQTRVGTVIPYFKRFMEKFPTVHSLAAAEEQEVLKAWEGLGYYSRARNLLRAAREIVSRYGENWPTNPDEWRQLPGIGIYTANAICSQAFNCSIPAIDGNVVRVFCRLLGYENEIVNSKVSKELAPFVQQCLPPDRPGDFNQASMELGATVCVPGAPLCRECPLNQLCKAFKNGKQNELPRRAKKPAIPHYTIGAGLIWREGKLLITRRPSTGLLGGLWEFPGGKQLPAESIPETIRREILEEVGLRIQVGEEFMTVKHAYSHFKITLVVHHCQWEGGEPTCYACSEARWVEVNQLTQFPFPRANQKIIARLLEQQRSSPKKSHGEKIFK